MNRRLLVTGAAGFIGTNFVHYWSGRHPDDHIVAYDALTYAGHRDNLRALEGRPRFRFVHGDIRDQEQVQQLLLEERLDTIVHFAAESHVDRSISDPDAFIQTNVVGTHALLKAARAVWLDGDGSGQGRDAPPHRFHHVSTDEVYGSLATDAPAFHERQQYQPNSPYSASKAASDHLVRAWHHTYGLQTTTSNCSNNYGPWHHPEKLIPLCLTSILRGRPLPVYGDGGNVRDWLFVEDHCAGIERVLQDGQPGQTYNIGGDNERANIDVVNLLCDRLDARFGTDSSLAQRFPDSPAASGKARTLVEHVQDRPGHDWRYAIDASKIKTELGFSPQHTFEQGIETTIDWYLVNEDWWQQLLEKC